MRIRHSGALGLVWFLFLTATPSNGLAEPIALNDSNVSVAFDIDSTWHRVRGTAQHVHGFLAHSDPASPSLLASEIRVPVSGMSTGKESRDERMREVMAADRFADVVFRGDHLSGTCHPDQLPNHDTCVSRYVGSLTIRETTLPLELPVTISRHDEVLDVTGDVTFRWDAFGIEDPSILVAHLDEEVHVAITAHIPRSMYGH